MQDKFPEMRLLGVCICSSKRYCQLALLKLVPVCTSTSFGWEATVFSHLHQLVKLSHRWIFTNPIGEKQWLIWVFINLEYVYRPFLFLFLWLLILFACFKNWIVAFLFLGTDYLLGKDGLLPLIKVVSNLLFLFYWWFVGSVYTYFHFLQSDLSVISFMVSRCWIIGTKVFPTSR